MITNILRNDNIIRILISVGIFLVVFLLRPMIAYVILKIFNWKKTRKEIKQISLYSSIKKFIILTGIYIAVIYFSIPNKYMEYVTTIYKVLVILIFTIGISKSITADTLFLKKIQDKIKGENTEGMLNVIVKVIRFMVYLVGGFLIITELGYNLNGLVTGLGLGTVVITLAAQDTAKSLFSGLTIALDRPFVVGDSIKIAGYEGQVEAITFKSTRIRTAENTVANIPNTLITSQTLVNETKRKRRKYQLELIFTFDTSLDTLKNITAKIDFMLKHNDDVVSNTVNVKFVHIENSGYKILINCTTNTTESLKFLRQSEYINYQIMEIINKENAQLAYPSSTVYIKNEEK